MIASGNGQKFDIQASNSHSKTIHNHCHRQTDRQINKRRWWWLWWERMSVT